MGGHIALGLRLNNEGGMHVYLFFHRLYIVAAKKRKKAKGVGVT
jgi:hypothetical protein